MKKYINICHNLSGLIKKSFRYVKMGDKKPTKFQQTKAGLFITLDEVVKQLMS